MPSQQFSIGSLQALRRFIKQQLVLPACEHIPENRPTDELPEPDSLAALGTLFQLGDVVHTEGSMPNANGQWFISTVDAGVALKHLPGLALKPSYCFVTYLYRIRKADTNHGGGVTWAMASSLSTTSHLEAALAGANSYQTPPYPEGALPNYMKAVTGNWTEGSFMTASVLQRELQEFGRCGQFYRWHHHRLIASIPPQRRWKWRLEKPTDLHPKVRRLPNGKITVEFYTCRVVPPVGIFRHVDRYSANSYAAKISNQPIAAAKKSRRS